MNTPKNPQKGSQTKPLEKRTQDDSSQSPQPLSSTSPHLIQRDEMEEHQQKELDIIQDLQEVVVLAANKKGYRKRLEKIELRIRHLQACERELELYKKKDDLADFTHVRERLQEITDSQIDASAQIAQNIAKVLKDEVIGTLKKELLQDISTTISKEIRTQLQTTTTETIESDFPALKSYANALTKPTKPKPALVISPKEAGLPPHRLKSELNKCSKVTNSISDCFATRGGKVIIKCPTDHAKQVVQEALAQNKDLTTIATIQDSKPRKIRIMIFGGPQAPVATTRFKQGDELPQEVKEYLDDFITPALQKHLHKDLPDLNYKLIHLLQAQRQKTHIVLELPEQDATLMLNSGKILLGFNSCTVKRYINISRCYKCQRYGHTSQNCSNPPCCVNCGEAHTSGNRGADPPCLAPPTCINCTERKKQEIQLYKEKKISKYTIFNVTHRASDRHCEVYRATLRQAQEKLLNLEKRQN